MDASTPRPPFPRGRRTGLVAPVLAGAVALLISGCGSDSDAKPPAKPKTVEQMAKGVGCKAHIGPKAKDYRSGNCKTKNGEYLLFSFANNKAQKDWLEYAQSYGGVYLVGKRWIVAAKPQKRLADARTKLGGTIEKPKHQIGPGGSGGHGSGDSNGNGNGNGKH